MKKMNNKGFSLVELLVAIAILAIVTVPLLHAFVTSAKTAARSRQMGNATIAGKNLAEYVESNTINDILKNTEKVFNPNGETGVELKGYGLGGIDPGYDEEAAVHYIGLTDVPGGGTEFEARVTLDAGGVYEERNEKPMSEYGDMDAVFAQSRSDVNDPDAVAQAEFIAYANREHTSWDDDRYSVTRTIKLTVKEDTADASKLTAELVFIYDYVYTYTVNELQDNGTFLPQDYPGSYKVEREYTLFPHGYTYKMGTTTKYPNIYLMYYPMYGATADNITVHNEEDIPFTLFLVKQKDPNLADYGGETTYKSEISQYQGPVLQGTPEAERYLPAATIYSNAKEAFTEGAPNLTTVLYKLYFGQHLSAQTQFPGEDVGGSLVGQSAKNRLYKVTVEIFMAGDNFNTATPLYTVTTTKLQ